ncbi:MAG: Fe-S cluster assembly protein SufD [Verrucomicrobiae bacterium]|nr:Fe-S cluster assembly protein SufD [Verrucomicrobiae bacterium]
MTPPVAKENPHVAAFEKWVDVSEPAWLRPVRKAAMSHFIELGFPTTDHEEWRFTPVTAIEKLPFKPVQQYSANGLTRESIEKFCYGGLKSSRLVFVDGHFSPELSAVNTQPAGVRIANLAGGWSTDRIAMEKHLARHARSDENSFTALNTSFFQDGAFIHIPKGVTVPEPILILHIATSGETGSWSHQRNLIVAERESKATVIESYVSLSNAAAVTNTVTEIVVEENASLEHCKVQRESLSAFHVATIQAQQQRVSRLLSHSIAIGSKFARNDIHSIFEGEGAFSIMNGLYIGKGDQLIDHHTVIDHAKAHCESHEYYNGVLDEKARGVFNGKIFVRKDAQKTDAKQTSRALLLSDDAMVDAKPQLEIFADDVKCTHGSTVGQLDDDAIFYLRARGIGLQQARQMLVVAFAGEILDRITIEPVREELHQLLVSRLAGKDIAHVTTQ